MTIVTAHFLLLIAKVALKHKIEKVKIVAALPK